MRSSLIIVVILIISFVLIAFVKKPQIILASTGNQSTSAACSKVEYYCLIMGKNSSKGCVRPSYCPPAPTANTFQPAYNSPQSTTNTTPNTSPNTPQTPTTNSTTKTTCTSPPSVLTSKLIIHFSTDVNTNNGYTIRSVDKPALNKFAAALKKYPKAVVTIDGYTDSVPFAPGTKGPINTNQALSVARAKAAETYLKSKGATANKYVIKGHGASNYVAKNNSKTGNILNRRDEITTNLSANTCKKTKKSTTGVLIMSNIAAHSNTGQGDYCLTNVSGSSANGSKVGISQCNASDKYQHWVINSNNTITMNGKCLDVQNKQTSNGGLIILNTCNGGKSQQWSQKKITTGPATGQTEIVNALANKCLNDTSFSTTNGKQQEIYTCKGTDNQSWFVHPEAIGASLACVDKSLADSYYAGYLFPAPANTNKLTVSADWIVNSFTCRKGDNSYSQWPGIGNYKHQELAQVGSYNICNGATATYNNPWTMAFPDPFVDPPKTDIIKVHDEMYASIIMTKPGVFNTILQDRTQGWTYKITMDYNKRDKTTYNSSTWSADYNGFITEAEGNDAHATHPKTPIYPLPKFNDAYVKSVSYSLNGAVGKSLSKAPGLYCESSGYQKGSTSSTYIMQDNTSPIRDNHFYVTWLNYK